MKKLFNSFFCMLFFLMLPGCKSLTLERQYTEFYTLDGVGYICEYVQGQKLSCKVKEETNEKKEQITAFYW